MENGVKLDDSTAQQCTFETDFNETKLSTNHVSIPTITFEKT